MKKELLQFIKENNLSPFSNEKTSIGSSEESIYKTKDAKSIHTKLIGKISQHFYFRETSNLFNFFPFTSDINEIKERQEFIRQIKEIIPNDFLSQIISPKRWWKPKYSIIVATEDEETFRELQKIGCLTKYIITQNDLDDLRYYDIVQIIDCENFSHAIENLPQAVFLKSLDEVYLERYVQLLSAWKANLDIMKDKIKDEEILSLITEIDSLSYLLLDKPLESLTREKVESALTNINLEVSQEIKKLTLSGDILFTMLSKSIIPDELSKIIKTAIANSNISGDLFNYKVPVEIDEIELEKVLKKQTNEENTGIAGRIKRESDGLSSLPKKVQIISDYLLLFDFISGLSHFLSSANSFPQESEELSIRNSENIFIEKAQPISFHLDSNNRCSILTGANSGGKTTLLEHVIQLITLNQLGLPVSGELKIPLFQEVYYFAKNKGSLNKGAFETLLTQMSKIKPGKKTLILADEIESVTEPGVAGTIVCASADFFLKQGCFLIIATHLGKEIQKNLPQYARVDGIEAKGLDESFELIVDHNPILGRLANSTPELIIERMANSYKTDYFNYLYNFLKGTK